MNILIAEDDPTTRVLLTVTLKKMGFSVVEASDGEAAWNILRQPDAPPMAILDWMMPGMEGLEVVRRVRALQPVQLPYLIMVTARSNKADMIVGLDAGANDYLAKPFDVGELSARVAVGRRFVEMVLALARSRERLAELADHDSLTGLLNRRSGIDALDAALSRVGSSGEMLIAGMCDLDHFKRVNDTCGHGIGDEVLQGAAELMRRCLRPGDTVARMGGEEFLVLSPMPTGVCSTAVYERLRTTIAETPIVTSAAPVRITISIGVARFTVGETRDGLLARADTALYQAKALGRNRVVFADE